MVRNLSDAWLMGMAVLSNKRAAVSTRAKNRLQKLRDEELGQTPTEYLMIAGLMAAVIVVAFVTLYWDNVKTAAASWTATVTGAITAGDGKNTGINP
jgi:Flp pilus assembly pilin Flp